MSVVSVSNDPLGNGEVDQPSGHFGEVSAQRSCSEDGLGDAAGEGLGACGETECVRPDHPRSVSGDVPAADRCEAEDQAGAHQRSEDEARHEQDVSRPGLWGVEDRQPQG
jgi:hypothetical protein